MEPVTETDEFGEVRKSAIKTYGETIPCSLEKELQWSFPPGFTKWESNYNPRPMGLKITLTTCWKCRLGENEQMGVEFYAKVMGFYSAYFFDDKDISTDYTALMSKVMSNGNGRIKFPSMNPRKARKSLRLRNTLIFMNPLESSICCSY